MKKQSGFTLIELMVVMAIIAILATAGLSAYTGYIKKARDTTRIADLAAINTIVLADMAADGIPPTTGEIPGVITTANNGQAISDPLASATSCLTTGTAAATTAACTYQYQTCDSGTTYRLLARLESTANKGLYNVTADDTTNESCSASGAVDCTRYAIGPCSDTASSVVATVSI